MPEMLLSFCICLSWRDRSPAAADEDAILSVCLWAGEPSGDAAVNEWTRLEQDIVRQLGKPAEVTR